MGIVSKFERALGLTKKRKVQRRRVRRNREPRRKDGRFKKR
jgi:hypothetical protein